MIFNDCPIVVVTMKLKRTDFSDFIENLVKYSNKEALNPKGIFTGFREKFQFKMLLKTE
jgi:hypothetical protein